MVSNTIASLPFIFLISFVSSPGVYFIAGLDYNPFEKYVYFVLELFMARTHALCFEQLLLRLSCCRRICCAQRFGQGMVLHSALTCVFF